MDGATVSVTYLRVLLEGGRRAGVAVEALLAPFELGDALDDPEGRVASATMHQLWEQIAARSGDAAFGLHLAEQVEPGAFAVLDYAVRNAPTLGKAYGRIARYHRLVHDSSEVKLELDGPEASISYVLPALPAGSPRHAAEFIVGLWLVAGRQLVELDFVPTAVRFQHPRPPATAEHARLFGCPLEFEAPLNELRFERTLLGRPVAAADPRLSEVIERYARELDQRLPPAEDFTARVRRLVGEELRGGDPSLETIAAKLHMSARTLQRRLKDAGISHQELVDLLRRELAQKYLREPSIAIGETAFLLGFSEPSAFHRAFKRWTGVTPGEFRRSNTPLH